MAIIAVLLLMPNKPKATYHTNQGQVFGTYYAIHYESVSDLHDSIRTLFAAFDGSMSMFNPQSTLSRINRGEDSVADEYFVQMYRTAEDVHLLSDRAFDITVAPLVNLWGFGLKNRTHVEQAQVDSLLPFVGMEHLSLVPLGDGQHFVLRKSDAAVQVDGGAIAKGQSCDIIASLLSRNGSKNYLVDIGGEVVAHGCNPQGQFMHMYYFDRYADGRRSRYFDWGNYPAGGGGVTTEWRIAYRISDKVPLRLMWCTRTFGRDGYMRDGELKRAYSTYIEARYDQPLPYDITLSGVIGITPWRSMYTGFEKEFAVVNLTVGLSKSWRLTEYCSVDVGGVVMFNPSSMQPFWNIVTGVTFD